MNPLLLSTPNANLPRKPVSSPPTPKHTQSTSSSSSRPPSSFTGNNNIPLLLSSTRPSTESARSSGEYTAATIYSMYSDQPPDPLPPLDKARRSSSRPSSAKANGRLSSRDQDDSGHLSVSVSTSAGKHASSTAWSEYHRPTSSAISTPRSSLGALRKAGKISDSPEPIIVPPLAPEPSVSPATPIIEGSRLSLSPPPNALHLLPVPDPLALSRPNSASSSGTHRTSTSASASLRVPTPSVGALQSENGGAEDADSLYVRSTYARLEQSGVPGDGYEEGIERTRARAPGKVEKRHTIFGPISSDLSQQELDLLSTLDRYGFKATSLSSRQENRLALLPIGPLKKPPGRVKTPPSSPPAPTDELKALPAVPDDPKELKRIAKWERMMTVSKRDKGGNVEAWAFNEKKRRKIRERIYKGVPDRWRSAVWWTLIDGSKIKIMSPPFVSPSPSYRPYQTAAELGTEYRERVDRPSTHDIQIDLDVPRTISGHVMFHTRYGSGQRALFHVLHSFSLVCESCGYCQGMGSIAATLLCYLDPERAYASMVRIHDAYDMHSIFSPGFPGLLESIYVQERLTEQLMPDVYASFKKHMVSSTSYATKWYITLFASTFPFQTQLRLWDAFFLEGRDVMVIIALAIIWTLREHLASAQASFETILSLLSSYFVAESEDALLSWMSRALGNKRLRSSMTQWRLDWRELVKKGQDMTALL